MIHPQQEESIHEAQPRDCRACGARRPLRSSQARLGPRLSRRASRRARARRVRRVLLRPHKWQFSTTWRHQKSDRHFVGPEEQEERQEIGNEVVNTLNLVELGIRYNLSDRTSLSVGIPYLMAERSNALTVQGNVIGRTVTHASALGDITLMGRRLFWKPSEHPNSNIRSGSGSSSPPAATTSSTRGSASSTGRR